MHHTGKPPKDKPVKNVADLAYLGIGSSELTNWARAVSVMVQNSDDNDVYELTHANIGRRSGVEGRTFLTHAEEGKIYWRATTQPEKQDAERESKYAFLKLEYMPELSHDSDYARSRVFEYIGRKLREHGKPSSFARLKKYSTQHAEGGECFNLRQRKTSLARSPQPERGRGVSKNFTSILYFFKSKFSRAEKYSPVNIYPHLSSFKEERVYFTGQYFG